MNHWKLLRCFLVSYSTAIPVNPCFFCGSWCQIGPVLCINSVFGFGSAWHQMNLHSFCSFGVFNHQSRMKITHIARGFIYFLKFFLAWFSCALVKSKCSLNNTILSNDAWVLVATFDIKWVFTSFHAVVNSVGERFHVRLTCTVHD